MSKKRKPATEPIKVRNTTARAAWERGGAGVLADRRLGKLKTRQAKQGRAIAEQM